MHGIIGRASGQVRLQVMAGSTRSDLEPQVLAATRPGTVVNTDEWKAYDRLPEHDRIRRSVRHSKDKRDWARDDDGDGVREVHDNTMEGFWSGLRNFLRPFRGVSKHHLNQYVAVYQEMHNRKRATPAMLHAVFGGFTRTAA